MKAGFALNLTHDVIGLLQRTAQGWSEVGRVDLMDPALGQKLAELRDLADALAPNGFACKLILPESQILYTEAKAPGPDNAGRRKQIAAALEGRTPYRPEELVFDWSGTGKTVQVAVVAKVTLDEAEAFAESHRFNPVSFVTRPPENRFGGEPFFGLTTRASHYLPDGDRLDRDQDPVRIIGAPDAFDPATSVDRADAEPIPAVPSVTAPSPEAASLTVEAPRPARPAATDNIDAQPAPTHETPEPDATNAAPDSANTFAVEDGHGADKDAPPAPVATEPVPVPAPTGHFQSRRSLHGSTPPDAAPTGEPATTNDPVTPAETDLLNTQASRFTLSESGSIRLPETEFAAADVASGGVGVTADHVPIPDAPATETSGVEHDPTRSAGLFGRALLKTLPDGRHFKAGSKPDGAPVLAGQSRFDQTVFAARRSVETINRRQVGFAVAFLATALLAMILGWVLWPDSRQVSSPDTTTSVPATGAADLLPPEPSPDVSTTSPGALTDQTALEPEPTPVGTALPDNATNTAQGTPSDQREALPDLAAVLPDDATPSAVPSPERSVAPTPAVSDPTTDHALNGTGIAHEAPVQTQEPDTDASGGLSLNLADKGPAQASRADLPEVSVLAPDAKPDLQPLPPPFGTIIRYSEDGLIIPTPEGVVTSDGITIIAGPPPVIARQRPARQSLTPAPEPDPLADPALAGKNPRPRPEGLVPNEAALSPDAAEPGIVADPVADPVAEQLLAIVVTEPPAPPVDPSHAARKPIGRPDAVVDRALLARATEAAITEAAAAAQRAEQEASRLAVATSRRPSARPRSFASAVEAAVVDAVATAEPATDAPADTTPAPTTDTTSVEIDEPEPEFSSSSIPNSTTVAKQATVKNAIDLGEVSLIGVYGSSSNRRALVRMPNGKFIKVKIGDRLDGGKVAAIGDSEVSYVKGGRTIVLKLTKKS